MKVFTFLLVAFIIAWIFSWKTIFEEDLTKKAKRKIESLKWKMYKEKRKAHDIVHKAEMQVKKAKDAENAYFDAFHKFLEYKGDGYGI